MLVCAKFKEIPSRPSEISERRTTRKHNDSGHCIKIVRREKRLDKRFAKSRRLTNTGIVQTGKPDPKWNQQSEPTLDNTVHLYSFEEH